MPHRPSPAGTGSVLFCGPVSRCLCPDSSLSPNSALTPAGVTPSACRDVPGRAGTATVEPRTGSLSWQFVTLKAAAAASCGLLRSWPVTKPTRIESACKDLTINGSDPFIKDCQQSTESIDCIELNHRLVGANTARDDNGTVTATVH